MIQIPLFIIPYSLFKKTTISLHRLFFYLTCILLPVQLGYHVWPSWAMVLGRRVDYLSPTLYLTDILVALTLISWGIEEWGKRKRLNINPLFVAGCLVVLCNTVFSKNIPVSVYQWMKVIEFGMFGFYIAETKPKIESVVTVLSVAVVYSSVIALTQFILQRSIGGPLWLLGERTFFADTPGIAQINLCDIKGQSCSLLLRPYGTFPHPNVLGGFLAVTLPYLFNSIIGKKKQISGLMRKLCMLSFIVGVCALVVTFGRSAWIAGVTGILFVLHHALRIAHNLFYKKYMKVLMLGAVSVTAACIYFFSGNFIGSESVVVRNELNAAAIKMIQENLFFGVGWGNFLTALPSYLITRTIYFLQPVHNIYLLTLSQVGVVGVSFIIVWIVYGMKRMRKINPIAGIPLLLVFLLGFTDHYFLTLQQGQLIVSIFVGLFLASGEFRKFPTA